MNVSIMTLKHLVIWVESAEIHGAVITAMDVTSLSAVMRGKGGEVGMTREDVISWLEYLSDDARSKAGGLIPTNIEIACRMAIDALKAQEPRVMGVGDLYGEDMGFYERKGEELVWPVLIARGGPDDDGTVGIVRKDAFEIKADCGLINQTWRIWTAYPTDEQREAVPWNAQK